MVYDHMAQETLIEVIIAKHLAHALVLENLADSFRAPDSLFAKRLDAYASLAFLGAYWG
jgi:AraC-like DNA-binding protein